MAAIASRMALSASAEKIVFLSGAGKYGRSRSNCVGFASNLGVFLEVLRAVDQAVFRGGVVSWNSGCLRMWLRRMKSFRMTAVRASLAGLLAARSLR